MGATPAFHVIVGEFTEQSPCHNLTLKVQRVHYYLTQTVNVHFSFILHLTFYAADVKPRRGADSLYSRVIRAEISIKYCSAGNNH